MPQIDMIDLLANLPKTARESVMYSLSGSANAAVINASQFIVGLCDREGLHVDEEVANHQFMNIAEIAKASAETGTGNDWFTQAGVTVAWADQCRQVFMATTGKDIGGLQSTLDFMTNKPRLMKQTDADRVATFLNDLDDAGITPADVKTIFDTAAVQRCIEIKSAKHNVEIVMSALPAADLDNPFEHLTDRQQQTIVDKTKAALLKARNKLMLSVASPNSNQDIGDYAFINAAIRTLKANEPTANDIKKAAGRKANTETSNQLIPTAPGINVRLSEYKAKYLTGKLAKPKAVDAVRDYMKCTKFEAGQTVASWGKPKVKVTRVAKPKPELTGAPATPEQLAALVTQAKP